MPLLRKTPGMGGTSTPSVLGEPRWPIHGFPMLCLDSSRAASIRGLGVEPMLDMGLKQAEGDGSLLQHGVVERADVEFGTEAALGFGAQLANFELAEFVGEGLAGPDDVAIDFDGDVLIGLASV